MVLFKVPRGVGVDGPSQASLQSCVHFVPTLVFFRHAGAYSAEEVVRIMREKLIRLQKLYIDQFQRLRYLLREEGRKYKHSVLAEKEAELSSIHSQVWSLSI